MNAFYLHKPDGTPTKFSMCGNCGQLAGPGGYNLSQTCCLCYRCGLPLDEIARKTRSLYHVSCERMRRQEADQKRMDEAEEILGYDGPVYLEGVGHGSYGDCFFENVQELSEHLDFHEGLGHEFAFACKPTKFRGVDAGDIYEELASDMSEDYSDHFSGTEEFEKAIQAFNEANAKLISWDVDLKHKVRIT